MNEKSYLCTMKFLIKYTMTMKPFIIFCLTCVSAVASAETVELGDTSRVVDLDEVVVVKDLTPLRRQPVSSTIIGAEDIRH